MFSTPKFTFCWILLCAISFYFLSGASAFARKNDDAITKTVLRDKSQSIATSKCIFKYLQDYFDNQRLSRKSIYLLANNHENKLRSIEEEFLIEFHRMKDQWLSIQLSDLDDFIEIGRFDSSMLIERRNFVWFLNDIDDEQVLGRLASFNAASAEASYLHLICMRSSSDEQISTVFEIFFKGSFGKNVNILMAYDVDKWTWYSHSSGSNEHCSGNQLLAKVEFHWQSDQCVRVNGSHLIERRPSIRTNGRCQLTVGSIHLPPYAYYHEKRGFYKGIEYYMIETIAKKLNRDVIYRYVNAGEYFKISDTFSDPSNG